MQPNSSNSDATRLRATSKISSLFRTVDGVFTPVVRLISTVINKIRARWKLKLQTFPGVFVVANPSQPAFDLLKSVFQYYSLTS